MMARKPASAPVSGHTQQIAEKFQRYPVESPEPAFLWSVGTRSLLELLHTKIAQPVVRLACRRQPTVAG